MPEYNISGVSYLRRFTQAERIAIRAAAQQSAELDDYLKLLDATIAQGGVVNLLDDDTVAAVNLLEQYGLIGVGRAAKILEVPQEQQQPATPSQFVATHAVDGLGAAMLEQDGTVRFENGQWTTLDALIAMGKTMEDV